MEEARLVACDGEAAIREPHAAFEEQPSHRFRATKPAIDFRVQSANKRQAEEHQSAQFLKDIEPGGPTIHDDIVRFFTMESARDPRQGAHSVESPSGVESATRKNFYLLENDTIRLADLGRDDDDIVSAGYQLEGKQGDLKFCAAGRVSSGRVKRQVSVPGQEEEFHAGRLIERAGFPATTSPAATS